LSFPQNTCLNEFLHEKSRMKDYSSGLRITIPDKAAKGSCLKNAAAALRELPRQMYIT